MTAHSGTFHPDGSAALPAPLDSETAMLLRTCLLRHFKSATSWGDLCRRLKAKGYEIAFRSGHLVLIDENGTAICTGTTLGTPLARLANRLGRPRSVRGDR